MNECMDIFITEYILEVLNDKDLVREMFEHKIKEMLIAEINAHLQHPENATFDNLSTPARIILERWEEYNKQRIQGGHNA